MSKSDTPSDWITEPYAYHCAEHGWWDAKRESGCPSCVVDARRKIALLERRCAELEKDATTFRLIVERRLSCSIWDWRDGSTPEWVVIAKDLPRPVIRTYSELGIAVLECVKALDLTIALATQEPSK